VSETDTSEVLKAIRAQASAANFRVTQHAQQEMVEENISLDETLQAIVVGQVLENYPRHRRGPCCLLHGVTDAGRNLHVVCTTALPLLIIITVYEPLPPKWPTPTQRRQ
jgi:type II secretory pathway pseudopilin PulG